MDWWRIEKRRGVGFRSLAPSTYLLVLFRVLGLAGSSFLLLIVPASDVVLCEENEIGAVDDETGPENIVLLSFRHWAHKSGLDQIGPISREKNTNHHLSDLHLSDVHRPPRSDFQASKEVVEVHYGMHHCIHDGENPSLRSTRGNKIPSEDKDGSVMVPMEKREGFLSHHQEESVTEL